MEKLKGYALCIVSICCLNLRELGGVSSVFAGAPPSAEEVVARYEDRTAGLAPNNRLESSCPSPWSEEFQGQYQLQEDDKEGISFRWSPYEPSESELRLRYPPGERRPLWGY